MGSKKLQMFIFPYAGGSVASFKRLTDLIDERVDVITVEYPGRGTRAKDSFCETIDDLIDDAIQYCCKRKNPELPYTVMGYSMGSILAYEMIARKTLPGILKHLFIAAEVSPQDRSLELRKVNNPTEERILERAKSLGGLDERMLKNKRFSDIYIKPMLSDYRLFFGYHFSEYAEKIRVDTTFFYCEKDTAYGDLLKWEELICGKLDFHEIGENHFFINQHYAKMAEVINKTLFAEV